MPCSASIARKQNFQSQKRGYYCLRFGKQLPQSDNHPHVPADALQQMSRQYRSSTQHTEPAEYELSAWSCLRLVDQRW